MILFFSGATLQQSVQPVQSSPSPISWLRYKRCQHVSAVTHLAAQRQSAGFARVRSNFGRVRGLSNWRLSPETFRGQHSIPHCRNWLRQQTLWKLALIPRAAPLYHVHRLSLGKLSLPKNVPCGRSGSEKPAPKRIVNAGLATYPWIHMHKIVKTIRSMNDVNDNFKDMQN